MRPKALLPVLALHCMMPVALAEPPASAEAFLDAVGQAVSNSSYRGTMVRSVAGRMDTLSVVHSNKDGFVREKLIALDGVGREIIRNGDEVVLLLPQRKTKIIETNAAPSNAFARLQAAADALDQFYTLERHGTGRVAGRTALRYYMRPRDAYRYGHKLWIDEETSLPLRMQLLSGSRVLEEIRFVSIETGVELADADFESDIDSSDFSVIQAAAPPADGDPPLPGLRSEAVGAATDENRAGRGALVAPSPGFRLRQTQSEMLWINGRVTRRLEFTDGLATVSVFIEKSDGPGLETRSQLSSMGAAHSFQHHVDGRTLTLVGEVPVETLRMLALEVERMLRQRELAVER